MTLHKLEYEGVIFKNVGACLGVGEVSGNLLLYLGALADVTFRGYDAKLGGVFLFGKIDPKSQVLKNMGFKDLIENLGATGIAKDTVLTGGYLRAYGDFPIYDYKCLFRINVGGRVAVWYFDVDPPASEPDVNPSYGGIIGGHVHGKLLCVVSARGDLTLQLYR